VLYCHLELNSGLDVLVRKMMLQQQVCLLLVLHIRDNYGFKPAIVFYCLSISQHLHGEIKRSFYNIDYSLWDF
jgi:hypothetical protein